MIGFALNPLVSTKDLQHGAIYKFHEFGEKRNIYARCNIDPDGFEYWFTDKEGKEVAGRPIAMIKGWDDSYRNRDIEKKLTM